MKIETGVAVPEFIYVSIDMIISGSIENIKVTPRLASLISALTLEAVNALLLLHPIVVIPQGSRGKKQLSYKVIAGQHSLRMARSCADLAMLPVLVCEEELVNQKGILLLDQLIPPALFPVSSDNYFERWNYWSEHDPDLLDRLINEGRVAKVRDSIIRNKRSSKDSDGESAV
jgi:hypothetical protein